MTKTTERKPIHRAYTVSKRFLVRGEGWKHETYEVEGTYEDAALEASSAARALDERFGDDHFWTVDVLNGANESYFQLFHGRLS